MDRGAWWATVLWVANSQTGLTNTFTLGFPVGSDGKESACNAGDLGSIPESRRSPGVGNSNPLQYSCLENSMDRKAWQAIVHSIPNSRTQLSDWANMHGRSYYQAVSCSGTTKVWKRIVGEWVGGEHGRKKVSYSNKKHTWYRYRLTSTQQSVGYCGNVKCSVNLHKLEIWMEGNCFRCIRWRYDGTVVRMLALGSNKFLFNAWLYH